MFEKEWDQRIHLYNHAGMMLGRSHHRRPLNHPALSFQPHYSHDREETTVQPHKERKKEKRHHHQEHFDDDVDLDHARNRTRPHHSQFNTDMEAKHQHASTNVDPELHQHHGKPKGLRASKRNNVELDSGHHLGRPKAPGVGHKSKPPKTVNFTDDVPIRKQPHHYAMHAQDGSRHSAKKSASNRFY